MGPDDLFASLATLGFNVTSLPQYYSDLQEKCIRSGSSLMTVNVPQTESKAPEPKRLKIGNQIDKPPFIPGYMHPLPEAHTFTETRTFTRVDDNYRHSRESYSEQSRNSDTSLISIHMNSFSHSHNMTGMLKNQSLFHSDPNQFQLLAPEAQAHDRSSLLQSFQAVLEQSDPPEVISARRAIQNMANSGSNASLNPFVQKLSRLKCFSSNDDHAHNTKSPSTASDVF